MGWSLDVRLAKMMFGVVVVMESLQWSKKGCLYALCTPSTLDHLRHVSWLPSTVYSKKIGYEMRRCLSGDGVATGAICRQRHFQLVTWAI